MRIWIGHTYWSSEKKCIFDQINCKRISSENSPKIISTYSSGMQETRLRLIIHHHPCPLLTAKMLTPTIHQRLTQPELHENERPHVGQNVLVDLQFEVRSRSRGPWWPGIHNSTMIPFWSGTLSRPYPAWEKADIPP